MLMTDDDDDDDDQVEIEENIVIEENIIVEENKSTEEDFLLDATKIDQDAEDVDSEDIDSLLDSLLLEDEETEDSTPELITEQENDVSSNDVVTTELETIDSTIETAEEIEAQEPKIEIAEESEKIESTTDVDLEIENKETEAAVEKEEIEDHFLNNLLSDKELEASLEANFESSDTHHLEGTFDVLKSVDQELESNLGLNKSKITEVKDDVVDAFELLDESIETEKEEVIIEETKTALVEDFTLHDDLSPSDEVVFAETLEVDFDTAKAEQTSSEKEIETNVDAKEHVEELTLEIEDTEKSVSTESESVLEESLDDDLFDFKNELNEEDVKVDDTLDNLLEEVATDVAEIDNVEENIVALKPNIADFSTPDDELEKVVEEKSPNDDISDSDLQSLLNEVRLEADKHADNDSYDGDHQTMSPKDQTNAEKRWIQLCGNLKDIKGQKEVKKMTFDASKHFLGTALKQIKSAKGKEQQFRLKYKDIIVVIDDSRNKVYCNTLLTDDEYVEFCSNEIDVKKIKIHDLDYSEERLYQSKIEKNPDRVHSYESFIWSTSLLTARGRLPTSTNITKPVGLKTWPNLTRLELIPHTMNMAAVFSKHPGSLLEVSTWLGIEQKYVFSFYSAVHALDMVDFDIKKTKKSGFSFAKKDSKEDSEERGFFGRLLKRLKT